MQRLAHQLAATFLRCKASAAQRSEEHQAALHAARLVTAPPPQCHSAEPVPLSALKEHKSGELAGWSLWSAGSNLQSLHFVPQKAFDYIMDEM